MYDPLRYLGLVKHKSRALDQAPPLAGWDLPAGGRVSGAGKLWENSGLSYQDSRKRLNIQ